MSSEHQTLVEAFGALEAVGPLRRRWLSTAWLVLAQAQDELTDAEQPVAVAIGENRQSVLEGIVLTDRRLGVIRVDGVIWHARDEVWEVSGIAASPVAGEVLNVYGGDWDHSWAQVRPLGVAPGMEQCLRRQLWEKQSRTGEPVRR